MTKSNNNKRDDIMKLICLMDINVDIAQKPNSNDDKDDSDDDDDDDEDNGNDERQRYIITAVATTTIMTGQLLASQSAYPVVARLCATFQKARMLGKI